jgi:hypothetical protein
LHIKKLYIVLRSSRKHFFQTTSLPLNILHLKIEHYLLFFLILSSCQQEKRWLVSGEYSHGLHLCTRDDGTFYAWQAADSSAQDTTQIAMLCVPHYPQANVAAWHNPHQNPTFFGVLTHLGADSFCIKMDTILNSTPFAKALNSKNGLTFKLEKKRTDWLNFYYFIDKTTAFVYDDRDFKSKKTAIDVKTRLYSSELIGEWAKVHIDSSIFWVHRSMVY